MINKIKAALENNKFKVLTARSAEEAKALALNLIGRGAVGIGGSVTVQQIGLEADLIANGNKVYWHWSGGDEMRKKATFADYYVCSANAITEDGKIVQIDGTGNRVAALCFGPKNAIIIAGKNKICKNVEDGVARIKSKCCGNNARRLNLKTPCALTDTCSDCNSPQRMCSVTAIFERPPKGLANTYVILVDEELGY